MKVGLHQDAVSSPLLFSIVMDVVTKEARSGLHWELPLHPDGNYYG